MFKTLLDLFRPKPVAGVDESIWHRAPPAPAGQRYHDAAGEPLRTEHVMQCRRDGVWEYREMSEDEYARKLFDDGAIM